MKAPKSTSGNLEDYEPPSTYDEWIAYITKRTRALHFLDNNPGGYTVVHMRRGARAFADVIAQLVEHLASCRLARINVEALHDSRVTNGEASRTYATIQEDLEHLRKSAEDAVKQIPDSRAKNALPFAARELLVARDACGLPAAVLSDDSEAVAELDRICRAAGIVLSPQRLRGALSAAARQRQPAQKRRASRG